MSMRNKAFTLLELSIVLLIISSVMGGAMMIFNQSLDKKQLQETKNKMAEIQKALYDYRLAFHRIPCPADITQNMDATSNNYYGVEAANSGSCISGTPAANFSVTPATFTGSTTNASAVVTSVSSTAALYVGTYVTGTGIPANTKIASIDSATQITLDTAATATNAGITITRNTIVAGMVPTKTLQLPDDYAIDGWGNRIMYVVDANLTAVSGFTSVPVTDTASNRILIKGHSFTGDLNSGSAVIQNVNSTSGLGVGTVIYGTGIPEDTKIASIDSSTQITVDKVATATAGTSTITAAKTSSAIYALISFGKNLHGAYPRSGGSTRTANYISADSDELTNCHCSSTASATTFYGNFVQKPISAGAYDDLVVTATRSDLRSAIE